MIDTLLYAFCSGSLLLCLAFTGFVAQRHKLYFACRLTTRALCVTSPFSPHNYPPLRKKVVLCVVGLLGVGGWVQRDRQARPPSRSKGSSTILVIARAIGRSIGLINTGLLVLSAHRRPDLPRTPPPSAGVAGSPVQAAQTVASVWCRHNF